MNHLAVSTHPPPAGQPEPRPACFRPVTAANVSGQPAETLLTLVTFNAERPTALAYVCYAELLFRHFLEQGRRQSEATQALALLSPAEHEAYDVITAHGHR